MNAVQRSIPPLQQPIPKRQVTPRPKRHLRQRSYRVMALETTVKIGVNFAIGAVAVSALVQLLPYHWTQQEKLRGIRTEVKLMETRVSTLQSELNRNFDPRQTKTMMQQQGYRFDPNQRQVVIMNQEPTLSEPTESSP
jgi:hypothetical protein